MEETLKRYKELRDMCSKYRYVTYILSYDEATDCPNNGKEQSNEITNYFSKQLRDVLLSDEYKSIVKKLYENKDKLDEVTRLEIEMEYKDNYKLSLIPKDELDQAYEDQTKCYLAWVKARKTLDYSPFYPELEKVVNFNKKLMKYWETDSLKGFDVILDNMEEGYTEKMYDEFFSKIETDLVPFIQKVLKCPQKYNPKLDHLNFPLDKQKQLTNLILNKMGYTNDVGCIRETIHPFTNYYNNKDVRITTHYHEDALFSSLYSVMHETGHALYQLQMADKYNGTKLFDEVTCISHESQSRFYENYLGRRYSFIKFLYPELKKLFPEELKDITLDDIYYYVNCAKANFTRTEADELTYPLHILIRYNVEKKLFHNEITVKQIPETFNYYMEKYLGIVPKDELQGCFQDIHWTSSFGYFPTYAVGSAYGAMFLRKLMEDVDVDKDLSEGNFVNINLWLKNKIHQYAATRKNNEIVKAVCGKDFDPNEYIEYLKDKFSKIYNI